MDAPRDAVGGAETHELLLEETPSHNHSISTGYKNGGNWHDGLAGLAQGDVGINNQATGIDQVFMDRTGGISRDGGHGELPKVLSQAGESRAHNNMPPYIALYYCKKE